MKQPILRNIVVITQDEANAIVTYFQNQLEGRNVEHHYWKEFQVAIEWLNHKMKPIVCDFVDLPPRLTWFTSWLSDTYKLEDDTYFILKGFITKVRPCQLLDQKTALNISKGFSSKNADNLRKLADIAFCAGFKDEAYYKENEFWKTYYPSAIQAKNFYDLLTQYLNENPCTPVQFQSLRKQSWKLFNFLSNMHERYINADDYELNRVFYGVME